MTKQELQEQRDTIIAEYKTSGLARSVFCRERGMGFDQRLLLDVLKTLRTLC